MKSDSRRIVIGFLAGCFFLLCLQFVFSLYFSNDPVKPRKSSWGQLTYDFGDARNGAKVRHVFDLTNPTDEIQRIRTIKASCSCTIIEEYDKDLSPGETIQIPLETTLGKVSERLASDAVVVFEDHPPLQLMLVGRSVESLPKEIDWGMLRQGREDERQLTLAPLTDELLEIQEVQCDERYFDIHVVASEHDSRTRVVTLRLKNEVPFGPFESPILIRVTGANPSEYRVVQKGWVAYPVEPVRSRIAIDVTRDGRAYDLGWLSQRDGAFVIEAVEVSSPELLKVEQWEGVHQGLGRVRMVVPDDVNINRIRQLKVRFDFRVGQERFSRWVEVFIMASQE